MTVAVLVPWRDGCVHRHRALRWATFQYARHGLPVELGLCPPGPFNRSAAILDAASRSTAEVFVVSDGDVYCDPSEAIAACGSTGWAVPHRLVHRLSAASTERVLAGADWRGLALSEDNAQDRKPYVGHEAGTLLVIRRDVLAEVPPDRRFVGWGQEDAAWSVALNGLVGKPWRGDADLVHLWHPPQPRRTRRVGNTVSLALLGRYQAAARSPEKLRALIEEARHADPCGAQPGRCASAPSVA